MKRLLAQSEVSISANRTVGVEIFVEGLLFTTRLHARTYDGLKVSSSYNPPERPLVAVNSFEAMQEASSLLRLFATLYTPGDDVMSGLHLAEVRGMMVTYYLRSPT